MGRDDENGVLEDAGNAVLPPIKLHSYHSGDYDSADEIVQDLDSEWDEYREEWDLEMDDFEEEFDVSHSGGFLRDEEVVIDSQDHRYVFSEDSGSMLGMFGGDGEGWTAETYTTEHFNNSEGPYRDHFMDLFIKQNFLIGESYIS